MKCVFVSVQVQTEQISTLMKCVFV